MNKKIQFIFGILAFSSLLFGQDIPKPSAYYNFNTDWLINENRTDNETATKLNDNSGNDMNAIWYNYNSEFPSLYGGFKDSEGKFGGAAYFSGYKSVCDDDPNFPGDNSPASARDALLFAGNASVQNWDVIDTSKVWQGVRKAFTVAYWWKSDRELTGNLKNACPPDQKPDWGEEETHFDGGSFWGVEIRNYYNYFQIGYRNSSNNEIDPPHKTDYFVPANGEAPTKGEWVHVALTFDGTTGNLSLYLNGELAKDWEDKNSNPNPIPTGLTQFDAVTFDPEIVGVPSGAVLFGATNGPSPSGINSGGNFWGEVPQYEGKFGYIEDHYRLGWAARGYLDEFAYWNGVALTKEQINKIMNNEISDLISSVYDDKFDKDLFAIYPNPTNGDFYLKLNDNHQRGNMEIVNLLGEKVYQQNIEAGSDIIDLNLSITSGIYFVKITVGNISKVEQLIVK